jgi:hypothetical protein
MEFQDVADNGEKALFFLGFSGRIFAYPTEPHLRYGATPHNNFAENDHWRLAPTTDQLIVFTCTNTRDFAE